MVIDTYQNLLQKVYAQQQEYIKDGEQTKAYVISTIQDQLASNFDKLQNIPQIINNPQVLSDIHLAIVRFVAGYKTADDNFQLIVSDDASIVIDTVSSTYISTADNRNCKDFQRVTFECLKDYPNHPISITTMQCTTHDGVGKDATDYDRLYTKSESDLLYIKDVYTTEGLQIQHNEAKRKTFKNNMYGLNEISSKFMFTTMESKQPDYNTLFGYSPKINDYDIEKIKLNTRGKYLGDEENIGMSQIVTCQFKEDGVTYDRKSYIEPINFSARGAYLSNPPGSPIINIPQTEEAEEIKDEAIKAFGGNQGWVDLVNSEKNREIPSVLHEYAKQKCITTSLGAIAAEQRTARINAQTRILKAMIAEQALQNGVAPEAPENN